MNDVRETDILAPPRIAQPTARRKGGLSRRPLGCVGLAAMLAAPARASLFQGDTLDYVADIVAWVALIVGPIVLIVVFWLVHILPEKIAEDRKHPQAKAIQMLCLLSLVFGGLLWPIAWLWAYTRPVLHKMAYGTDVIEHEADASDAAHSGKGEAAEDPTSEPQRLRMKVVDSDGMTPVDSPPGRERA